MNTPTHSQNNTIIISKIQSNILLNLGKFKFLVLSQLLRLDVGTKQYKYLWKKTSELLNRRKPFVGRIEFNNIAHIGKVENVYYLTKRGVDYLIGEGITEKEILFPERNVHSAKDYFHRKTTIDFQINVINWALTKNFNVLFFKRYFDSNKSQFFTHRHNHSTKIALDNGKNIIADAIFRLKKDKLDRVFVFELHNGNNSKRIYDQVILHVEALLSLSLHNQLDYSLKKAYYVLILFSEESTLKSFLKRIQKDYFRFHKIHQYFLCRNVKNLEETTFEEGWATILSEPKQLKI